jgi:hypothetical protein
MAVVRGGGVLHIAHLELVELRHLDAHIAPRLHPAVGDGGGVHAVALLLLKLRGARARLPCLGLALLLCLPRLLLIGWSRLLCRRLSTAVVSIALAIRGIHLVAGVAARPKAFLTEAPRLLEHLKGCRRVAASWQLVWVHAGG